MPLNGSLTLKNSLCQDLALCLLGSLDSYWPGGEQSSLCDCSVLIPSGFTELSCLLQ